MLAHRLSLGHALPDHHDDRRDVFERAIVRVIPGLRELGQVIDGDPVVASAQHSRRVGECQQLLLLYVRQPS
jgi:hypothetical protein